MALLARFSPAQVSTPPTNIPITGKAVPGFEEFGSAVVAAIQKNHIPGAAIAFVKARHQSEDHPADGEDKNRVAGVGFV